MIIGLVNGVNKHAEPQYNEVLARTPYNLAWQELRHLAPEEVEPVLRRQIHEASLAEARFFDGGQRLSEHTLAKSREFIGSLGPLNSLRGAEEHIRRLAVVGVANAIRDRNNHDLIPQDQQLEPLVQSMTIPDIRSKKAGLFTASFIMDAAMYTRSVDLDDAQYFIYCLEHSLPDETTPVREMLQRFQEDIVFRRLHDRADSAATPAETEAVEQAYAIELGKMATRLSTQFLESQPNMQGYLIESFLSLIYRHYILQNKQLLTREIISGTDIRHDNAGNHTLLKGRAKKTPSQAADVVMIDRSDPRSAVYYPLQCKQGSGIKKSKLHYGLGTKEVVVSRIENFTDMQRDRPHDDPRQLQYHYRKVVMGKVQELARTIAQYHQGRIGELPDLGQELLLDQIEVAA